MSRRRELDAFLATWEVEADRTIRLMEALPSDQYDFRPDHEGRTLGQLAWHLSEIDACISYGIALGRFRFDDIPPNLERPREIGLLAPGYRRIHEEAAARIKDLKPARLDEEVTFFDGDRLTIRQVLWDGLLHHLIHHRGQLVLMCRLAGGTPPGLFGPNREEMRAMQAAGGGVET